jgi:ketosteroid isomerase-like protein
MAITLIAAVALAGPAYAADMGPSQARVELVRLESEWTKATMAKDLKALDRLMAPDFGLAFVENDKVASVPRAAWLSNLGKMTISRYETKVESVEVMGSVAIAQVTGDWTVSMGGPARSRSFRLRDTWIRRDGRWQVVQRFSER